MARSVRSRRLSVRQLASTPYPIPSYRWKAMKEVKGTKKAAAAVAERKKDWVDATCSVCMEHPHNAVLLLCSSHDKGCRPYMCGTSDRHSNCLDQFRKAHAKLDGSRAHELALSSLWPPAATGLACPLCRGQVKGWTVVQPAREYLNRRQRSCMQEGCGFAGTYKELRKHVRSEHPYAKPREVDPAVEQKWRTLENERERQDVMSTIRSSMPGAVVFGDYVIEMGDREHEEDDDGEDDVDEDDEDVVGNSGVSRSILYLFFREGARLMRLQSDGNSPLANGYDAASVEEAIVGLEGGREGGGGGQQHHRRRRRQHGSHGRAGTGES